MRERAADVLTPTDAGRRGRLRADGAEDKLAHLRLHKHTRVRVCKQPQHNIAMRLLQQNRAVRGDQRGLTTRKT